MQCEHPECEKEDCGVEIQGTKVCVDHIDWAMEKAFAPAGLFFDEPVTPKCPECGDRHQATTPCYP